MVDKKKEEETKRQEEERKREKVESERKFEEERLRRDQLEKEEKKIQERLKKEYQEQAEICTQGDIEETKENPDDRLDTQTGIHSEVIDGTDEEKVETLGPEVRGVANKVAEEFLKELVDPNTPLKRKQDMLMMYLFTIP